MFMGDSRVIKGRSSFLCLMFFSLCFYQSGFAQGLLDGYFSGNLDYQMNFFIEDEEIGAANLPQYDNEKSSIDTWLNLIYASDGFEVGVRFDLFSNSNLKDPQGSYNGQGIGRFYLYKKIDKLSITGGYIYDQFGVGTIFRAYEERPLFIDNAMLGVQLEYELTPDWKVKVFGGKQKRQFDLYSGNIKGGSIEGFVLLGSETNPISLAPGFGVVNRTLGDDVVEKLVDEVTTYPPEDREDIELKYNAYAYSLYNTLVAGDFSWYVEASLKSDETIFDPNATRTLGDGTTTEGRLINQMGSVVYTSLGYSTKGFGLTFEGRRTEYFTFRMDPTLIAFDGQINYLPPVVRQNTYRLTARYTPAVQELSELAFQVDARYSPNKKWAFNINFSNTTTLDNELLFREYYGDVTYKPSRQWLFIGGLQRVSYNQEVYELKPDVPLVETYVPFFEGLWKFQPKKSLRLEFQYMNTDEDFGSWIFAQLELGLAPHWIFTVSDMYNIDPTQTDKLHYPTVGVVYSKKANRFSLSYVKQVMGVVCSGGICRLEPAFSGVRFAATSTF